MSNLSFIIILSSSRLCWMPHDWGLTEAELAPNIKGTQSGIPASQQWRDGRELQGVRSEDKRRKINSDTMAEKLPESQL